MKGLRQRVQEQSRTERRSSIGEPKRKEPDRDDDFHASGDFDSIINRTWDELDELTYRIDYEFSADKRQYAIDLQHQQLLAIDSTKLTQRQQMRFKMCIAWLQEVLGNFQEAEDQYEELCHPLTLEPHALIGLPKWSPDNAKNPIFESLARYFWFLSFTNRKPKLAEALIRVLLWIPADFLLTEHSRRYLLVYTIGFYNDQSNYAEASKYLMVLNSLFAHPLNDIEVVRVGEQSAIIEAGQGRQSQAQTKFIESYVISSACLGIWHPLTLDTLYEFGKALKDWGRDEDAVHVLRESCLGYVYTLGIVHPFFKRAFAMLKSCRMSQGTLNVVKDLSGASREKQLSVAYEHVCLRTPFDLLQGVDSFSIDYDGLSKASKLRMTKDFKADSTAIWRTVARCNSYLQGPKSAFEILEQYFKRHVEVSDLVPANAYVTEVFPVRLDQMRYLVGMQQKNNALRMSKATLLVLGEDHLAVTDGVIKTTLKKLASLGLTHFTYEILAEEPPLISKQNSEILGTGAYAVVDKVKIGSKMYARKSVTLPRYNQKSVRKIIENEISVIRTLDHPHIVQVHLTYEHKSHFYIIMRPLADCDLETFLADHTRKPPTQDQDDMVWRWLQCLSNTLAFIHSQGVRHKDIKPKNILVKEGMVIFADFGSSHAFLDEGNSTTEGPSFGHTKVYCAPEVMANRKRGRAADIFSLGCVFTELVVWLAGYSIAEWVHDRETVIDGTTTIAYSANLDGIFDWFNSKRRTHELTHDADVLHANLLRNMIGQDPATRLLALEITDMVSECHTKIFGSKLQQCDDCNLEIWMDRSEALPRRILDS
ncbi:Nn.00g034140.m01.CDS01 [Neocucurbitaria sp. VM-36]